MEMRHRVGYRARRPFGLRQKTRCKLGDEVILRQLVFAKLA